MGLINDRPARRAVSDIVFAYRKVYGEEGIPLSLRLFAELLNEVLLDANTHVTHQTVKNWEDRYHLPRVLHMTLLALNATDWRREFGEDVLAALRPKLYRPSSYIGRRALERSLIDTGPNKPAFDPYYTSLP